MAYTQFTKDMQIIQKLNDRPNALGTPPLAASELKEKFDEGGEAIKAYLNNTLLPELNGTAGDLATDEEAIAQNATDIVALKAKKRFLYADDSISYANTTSTTILKAKVHPDGEVNDYIIGKNGGVAKIIASMDSARWIISTQQMQLKPTGYTAAEVGYDSDSEVYGEDPPTDTEEALQGLEAYAEGLDDKIFALGAIANLLYYNGAIDTTKTVLQGQTGDPDDFYPFQAARQLDCFVDKYGNIGRITGVTDNAVAFVNMGMHIKPTGYNAQDISYASVSTIYPSSPANVMGALQGLEGAAETLTDDVDALQAAASFVFYEGVISTTSTSTPQYSTTLHFYPNVKADCYIVDSKGAVGRVLGVSGTDVVFVFSGMRVLPTAPEFSSVTVQDSSGGVTLDGTYIDGDPVLGLSETGDEDRPVRVTNVAAPTLGTDAANKAYVDSAVTPASIVTATGAMTSEQQAQTRQNIGADIAIGDFRKSFRNKKTTVVADAYIDTSGSPVSTSAWAYCFTDVIPGEKYKVTGVAGTGGRLYLFKNSAGQVIYAYPSEINVNHMELEITAPENAATLYVNTLVARISVPSIQETYPVLISDNYGGSVSCKNISGTKYKIMCGSYEHEIDLTGSNNGTFNFESLKRDGVIFKAVNDDIAPIKFQTVGYVGANHGYAWVYSCTIPSHGLKAADIGKTSTDDINTWVLIQVTDNNTVVVGCYDSSVWHRLKRVAPTTLNFGGSSLSVSTSEQIQLYPSVKNANITINSENPVKTVVTESYEIIDVGSGIESIMANVGSNTNTSVATRADALVRICNSYEFFENGSVVLYTGTKVLKTGIGIEYLPLGIQSGGFSASDNVCVPQVIGYDGFIPEAGTQIDFLKSRWKEANVPPQIYIQVNGTANTANKTMLLGYIINDNRADNIDDSSGFVSTAGKLYPFFVQPNNSVQSVLEFSTISYRIPQAINAFVSVAGFAHACGYTYIGNDIYLFINTYLSNGNIDFPVPAFMQRKKITTVMSKDMTCQSKVTTNVISLSYTTRGSIILKLSD